MNGKPPPTDCCRGAAKPSESLSPNATQRPAATSTATGSKRETMMKSPVVKRAIVIAGHKTSVSLEDAFWKGLKEIATARDMTLSDLVAAIDSERQHGNLSSAIRLFVLDFYRNGHSDHTDGRDGSRDLMAARAATGVWGLSKSRSLRLRLQRALAEAKLTAGFRRKNSGINVRTIFPTESAGAQAWLRPPAFAAADGWARLALRVAAAAAAAPGGCRSAAAVAAPVARPRARRAWASAHSGAECARSALRARPLARRAAPPAHPASAACWH